MIVTYKCEIDNIDGEVKSHVLEIGNARFIEKSVDELLYETSTFLSKEQCDVINGLSFKRIGGEINKNGIIRKFL